MQLRRRQKRRKALLDAMASITKTWSEWQVAKRAGKQVAKVKEVRPSRIKAALTSKPVKVAGGVAVVGGAGAVIARKLKGEDEVPVYSGPAPSEAVEAAAQAPESASPPPLTMAPDPATQPSAGKEPAVPESALRYSSSQPAATEAPDDAEPPEPEFPSAVADHATDPDEEPGGATGLSLASDSDDTDDDDDAPAARTKALRDASDDKPATSGDDDE